MCANSGQVVVSISNNVNDNEATIHMLEALEGIPPKDIRGDDKTRPIAVRQTMTKTEGKSLPRLKTRDETFRRIQELALEESANWQQEINCHQRSCEEALIFRYKTIFVDSFASRNEST